MKRSTTLTRTTVRPTPDDPPPDRLIPVAELGSRVQWTSRTIWNRLHAKPDSLPPAYKIGNKVMFKASEVEAWIDAQRLDLQQ